MLKRTLSIILVGAIMVPSLNATQKSGYQAVLELVQAKKINKTIERVNVINNYINRYILETATLSVTEGILKNKYNLDSSIFKGYASGQSIGFSIIDDRVKYLNIVPNLRGIQVGLYKKSPSLLPLSIVNDDLTIEIALNPKTVAFLIQKNDLSTDCVVSNTQPNDNNKLWYKPNGSGGFVVHQYDGSDWKVIIENTITSSSGVQSNIIVVKSKADLDKLKSKLGDIAYIAKDNSSIKKYINDGNNWLLESMSSSSVGAKVCTDSDIGVIKYDSDKDCLSSCQTKDDNQAWECIEKLANKSTTIYNSCYAIKQAKPNSKDGVYTIDPDGKGGSVPFKAYCDMTTDGGGWTQVFQIEQTNGYRENALPDNNWLHHNFGNINSKTYNIVPKIIQMGIKDNMIVSSSSQKQNYKEVGIWKSHNSVSTIPTTESIWFDGEFDIVYRPRGGGVDTRNQYYANGDSLGFHTANGRNIQMNGDLNQRKIKDGTGLGIVWNQDHWGNENRNICTGGCYNGTYAGKTEQINKIKWFMRGTQISSYTKSGNSNTPSVFGSCKAIFDAGKSRGDGVYTIDPDGEGGSEPFKAYCDMTTEGGGWMKIFYHDVSGGYFTSVNETLSTNIDNPNAKKYSLLNKLSLFKRDGKFTFMIRWPGQTIKNIWSQTSNPTLSGVSGYQPIKIDTTSNHWGGLEKSTSTSVTFIDGSVNHGNWYYSIGSKVSWGGGIPSSSIAAQKVELLVK